MGTNELATNSNKNESLQSILSFIFAVLTALSVIMIGVTSFTAFNPPDWLRIATMAPFPFWVIATVGFGLSGLKRSSGRVWAIVGLVLTSISVVAFIVMIIVGG